MLARADRTMDHGHAEALAPLTQAVLAQGDADARDLAAIGVTVGPGGFTGLRVGLAFARGLALAAGCPVLGATTTTVLALMARDHGPAVGRPLMVVLDARRAEVYRQSFDAEGRALDEVASVAPDALVASLGATERVLVGDGVALLPRPLPATVRVPADAGRAPDTAVLAALVAKRPDQAVAPRPLYVRPPDASLPAPHARTRP